MVFCILTTYKHFFELKLDTYAVVMNFKSINNTF